MVKVAGYIKLDCGRHLKFGQARMVVDMYVGCVVALYVSFIHQSKYNETLLFV
jgi:hypothetical protein